MDKILVMAGNREQFHNWVHSSVVAEPDMFVCADAHALLGSRYSAIIKIGTYYEHNDFDEIRAWAHHYFPEITL